MVRRSDERLAELTVVLDSGAVIGLARGDQRWRDRVNRVRRVGAQIVVPAVVVAETVRGAGPRDAPVNHILAGVDHVVPLSERVARDAGRRLALARRTDTIDAIVVAEAAIRAPAIIFTSDQADLSRFVERTDDLRLVS
jgi:predicted nucleic acid-binding protein